MRYVKDWSAWVHASEGCDFQAAPIPVKVAVEFKRIMGKWQACRPKSLRCATELQRTLDSATEPLGLMGSANLRSFQAPGELLTDTICSLWQIFESGLCLNGKATEVGVSKAILLVTKGRIGPAFDSNVKKRLKALYVTDCKTYIKALAAIASELVGFEARELTTLDGLAEKAGRPADVGRAVDMVLGPRRREQREI
ncbi:MAG: hypothetical protein LAN64_17265 [Acidobacteriia bacterium]|nr:hypothetical protein [Terriglobia bacterium]